MTVVMVIAVVYGISGDCNDIGSGGAGNSAGGGCIDGGDGDEGSYRW